MALKIAALVLLFCGYGFAAGLNLIGGFTSPPMFFVLGFALGSAVFLLLCASEMSTRRYE